MRILLATLHVRPSAQATPLAAANLKAALPDPYRQTTELLDLFLEQTQDQMLDAILETGPDLVAFPLYLWNRHQVLRLAARLRQNRPQLFLVAGGPEASATPAAILGEDLFDAVVRGEGETVFTTLVERLAAGQPLGRLPGVCTPDSPQTNGVFCDRLEQLPSPYLCGVLPIQPGGGVLWEVARGCPFSCSFCYDGKGHQGVRPIPESRLAEELQLFSTCSVDQVWVLDSTFNCPPERGHKLLRLLLKYAPDIHYHLEAKAELLDETTIQLLTRLHCSLQIGLQSAHPTVLRPLQRTFEPAVLFNRLKQLSEAGVVFGIDLIYGLPQDSHAGFRDSLDQTLEVGPNHVDLFPLAVLPGTLLAAQQEQLQLQVMPAPPYEILSTPSYPAEDLQQSRLLAAATDIFYNRGRAVGFLQQFCQVLQLTPTDLLSRFGQWLQQTADIPVTDLLAVEQWVPERILPLQQRFLAGELEHCGKPQLIPLAEDLLRYHFHYAETLLGPELLSPPQPQRIPGKRGWQTCWRRARELRLIDFHYELADLGNRANQPLETLYRQLRPVGSTGLFLRRGGDVFCESLLDEFARLLRESDGTMTPAQILPECPTEEGLELLAFAVEEGLLTA